MDSRKHPTMSVTVMKDVEQAFARRSPHGAPGAGRRPAVSVSVHVVNGTYGRPVVGLSARIDSRIDGAWVEQVRAETDEKGEIPGCRAWPLARGVYQIELDLDGYFSSLGITPFYPSVAIRFRISDPSYEHHISLLVTPSSYLTYRQD
jgi:5-hydroxyisourate hydrolase